MKRIILGLSVLLILAQNGFAETDAEFDKLIAKASDNIWKQYYKCRQGVENHEYTSKPEVCQKVIPLIKNSHKTHALHNYKDDILLKIGNLYYQSTKNYLKAYTYWMQSAKLGNTSAQGNLDILCREHSWVCK